jgi:hypothetical protein
VRYERLSYQVMKIQRNKYVSFLVVFTFAANMLYLWLKNKRYRMEELCQHELSKAELKRRPTAEHFLD